MPTQGKQVSDYRAYLNLKNAVKTLLIEYGYNQNHFHQGQPMGGFVLLDNVENGKRYLRIRNEGNNLALNDMLKVIAKAMVEGKLPVGLTVAWHEPSGKWSASITVKKAT